MIGTVRDLFNAANGKPRERQFINPLIPSNNDPVIPIVPGGSPSTFNRSLAVNMANSNLPIPGGVTSLGDVNDVYASIINSQRPSGGLSSKGKYSGFYTAEERNKAIEGGALQLSGEVPGTLRSKAQARYDELGGMKSDAMRDYSRRLYEANAGKYAGYVRLPGVDDRLKTATPGGYIDKYVNPSRTYENELQGWFKENAGQADQYVQAAQQLENTSLNDLAQAVATRQYGVNPSLAKTLFGDFEARQTKAQYDKAASDRSAATAAANQYIESQTGFKASTISGLAGRSPEQLYNGMAKVVKYRDPNLKYGSDDDVTQDYGYAAIDAAGKYIKGNDMESAFKIAESLDKEGASEVAAAVYAMLYLGGYNKENLKNKLYLAGIVSP